MGSIGSRATPAFSYEASITQTPRDCRTDRVRGANGTRAPVAGGQHAIGSRDARNFSLIVASTAQASMDYGMDQEEDDANGARGTCR